MATEATTHIEFRAKSSIIIDEKGNFNEPSTNVIKISTILKHFPATKMQVNATAKTASYTFTKTQKEKLDSELLRFLQTFKIKLEDPLYNIFTIWQVYNRPTHPSESVKDADLKEYFASISPETNYAQLSQGNEKEQIQAFILAEYLMLNQLMEGYEQLSSPHFLSIPKYMNDRLDSIKYYILDKKHYSLTIKPKSIQEIAEPS